jgi:hypothetical protein
MAKGRQKPPNMTSANHVTKPGVLKRIRLLVTVQLGPTCSTQHNPCPNQLQVVSEH